MAMVDISVVGLCKEELDGVDNAHELDLVKSKYMGPKSALKASFKHLATLDPSVRAKASAEVNEVKKQLGILFHEAKEKVLQLQAEQALANDRVDTTRDARLWTAGSRHPLSKTLEELKTLLARVGFNVAYGPEVESFYYNFTALNTPRHHPAVTSQDTLYIEGDQLLRSHTSCVQIRMMEKHKPPLRIFSPGRVFRADTPDATHSPCFMQCEGLVIDRSASVKDLVATLRYVLEGFFGQSLKLRLRPSFFPFTEPSFECDIWFKDKWLEVLGCGMVHPNVLRNVGLDPEVFQGYAFGLGIDRLTMLRYQIDDIRWLYEGDQAYLQQDGELC